jgi:hypothetical protein
MSPVIGIVQDALLPATAGLPSIVAFCGGAGSFRWLALLCGLLALTLFGLVSVGHHPLEPFLAWWEVVATWLFGWLSTALAIRRAHRH